MTRNELKNLYLFCGAKPIKGPSVAIAPSFVMKVRLLFSKKFKLKAGGHDIKHTFFGKFKAIFSKQFQIKAEGILIGHGLFEGDLIANGLKKTELKRLTEAGYLRRVTTKHEGGWRNTYVLPVQDEPTLAKHL